MTNENEETKKSIVDRVEDMKTSIRTFTIGSCPEKTYQRFLNYCRTNAKNTKYFQDDNGKPVIKEELIYHVGLRLLLDIAETDAKSMVLFEKIAKLEDRLDNIEKKFINPKVEDKKAKTMGAKE